MESDNVGKKEKILIHKKKDNRNRTDEKMKKYYSDPEKQLRLQERVKEYKDMSERYRLKAQELEKYILPENQTQG